MNVCVVGAGAGGLAAIKCCLDEGLEPRCYEKSDHIGGLWHYSPEVIEGQPSVMKSTVCNSNKEMMCYSDFPVPKEFSTFMHNREVETYLSMYTDKFGLRQHIKTQHEVIEIKETPDHNHTGRWTVTAKNLDTNTIEEKYFDAVIVCAGIFGKPRFPDIQGLSNFDGTVLHSHGYRNTHGMEDKRVLVVGIGNSAGDAAVDISNVARQVHLSTRSGTWVIGRTTQQGLPIDLILSRAVSYLQRLCPGLIERMLSKQLNNRFNHALYRFSPKLSIRNSLGFINDDLPIRVLNGRVKMKPDVTKFTKNTVEFEDGTSHEVDTILFGTGYDTSFPFLADDIIGSDMSLLYKGIFPGGRVTNTLAMIGCVRVKGGVVGVLEMQARVAVSVFKGHLKLPPKKTMEDMIQRRRNENRVKSPSLNKILQVEFVPYLDELADMIGCKPRLGRMLFTDISLTMKCLFGPCVPAQYRLQGPVPWDGARNHIMTVLDRLFYPLNPDFMAKKKRSPYSLFKIVVLVGTIGSLFYMYRQLK